MNTLRTYVDGLHDPPGHGPFRCRPRVPQMVQRPHDDDDDDNNKAMMPMPILAPAASDALKPNIYQTIKSNSNKSNQVRDRIKPTESKLSLLGFDINAYISTRTSRSVDKVIV